MSTQVVDLVRDSTMQKMQAELVAVHKASVLASGSTAATIPPPSSSPCGVVGRAARRRFSSAEMHRPISTTG